MGVAHESIFCQKLILSMDIIIIMDKLEEMEKQINRVSWALNRTEELHVIGTKILTDMTTEYISEVNAEFLHKIEVAQIMNKIKIQAMKDVSKGLAVLYLTRGKDVKDTALDEAIEKLEEDGLRISYTMHNDDYGPDSIQLKVFIEWN
jgi:hypothetical protein